MQFLPVLLAIVGSSAWLAMDAAKRDWTDNGFARNVPSWVVGSLLLWPVVFPLYVLVHRKKAPLLEAARPAPAAAMAAPRPAEAHGPSLDDVEPEVGIDHDPVVEIVSEEPSVGLEPEPEPEPVIALDHEPVVEILHEPVAPLTPPEAKPVVEPEPVVEVEPEPVVEFAPAPAAETAPLAFEPEPDPFVEAEAAASVEPIVAPVTEPEFLAPQPEPFVEPEPEAEPEPAEPVLAISHFDTPADEAPPGLSVDAFKDIKPVAFGGAIMDDPPAPAADPLPPAPEPEPAAAEPVSESAPPDDVELAYPVSSDPVIEIEPEPVAFEPEPVAYEPDPVAYEPDPVAYEPEPVAYEPEPVAAATAVEPAPVDAPPAKKRGFRLPNPELRLPRLGGRGNPKPKAAKSSASRGLKLPSITLPPNLQGPLNDVERKIVLGSVVAIVAAAAFGYTTAPSEDAAAPAPQAAPAAAAR